MNISKNIEIKNRAATYNYFVVEHIECGISLKGNEVKSIRCGMASLKEAWIAVENGNLVLKQMHITKYDPSNAYDVNTTRDRMLLAHKKEIRVLSKQVQQQGMTLIPLKVYFNKSGKCKVLVGVCQGKHSYDKRQSIKNRDIKRELDRAMKNS